MGFLWGRSLEARGAHGALAINKVGFSPIEGVFRQGRRLVAKTLKGWGRPPRGLGVFLKAHKPSG